MPCDRTQFIRLLGLLKPEIYFMYHKLSHSEIMCSAHNAFMCFAHNAFMCFVRISEQTAIISLYSIN